MRKRVVVVGAGVAGLTLAYKLGCAGHDVVVVESEPRVGGLARSFEYNGYVFDMGPHRFHTDIPGVIDFIKEILDSNYITIERKSGVWMFGRYFDWPLRFSSLFNMPLHVLLSVGMDLLKKKRIKGESFKDYIEERYGKTLYKIFFEPYTEKFLKMSCSKVSKDWAVTGIDRAVIDKRIRVTDAYELARSVMSPAQRLDFIYPEKGGIGKFSEDLEKKIRDKGGVVLVNSKVENIVRSGTRIDAVKVNNISYECDLLIWTAPITEILKLLGREVKGLDYLSLLLFNYSIDHEPFIDYQWCYYGSKDVPFNRVSIPSLFNPSLAPPGKSGMCVEVTCSKDSPEWKNPERLEQSIRKSLIEVGAVKGEKYINGLHIERVPNAYPIYVLDYKERQQEANKIVEEVSNLRLLGRTGSFWYNNMDHSISAALDLCKTLSPLIDN